MKENYGNVKFPHEIREYITTTNLLWHIFRNLFQFILFSVEIQVILEHVNIYFCQKVRITYLATLSKEQLNAPSIKLQFRDPK